MPPETFPLVAADDIGRLVGPAASERGQRYARQGAVLDAAWDAVEGVLTGSVAGSEPRPYRCRVQLVPLRDPYLRPTDGTCSCPVSAACKHLAALLFEGNRRHMLELGRENTAEAATDVETAGDPDRWPEAERDQAPAPTRDRGVAGDLRRGTDLIGPPSARADVAGAPTEADWRAAVGTVPSAANAFTAPSSRGPGSSTGRTTGVRALGLMFELRQLHERPHRWHGPTATAASPPLVIDAEYRLAVRPVILSDTGNWVRSGITWGTLAYAQQRLGLDVAQHRWFAQFGALQRSTRETFGMQEADWLYLDDFESPLLWPLIEHARALDIALVSGKKSTDIRLAESASVTIDATTDAGALHLDTVLSIDGSAVELAGARAIGDHGVYVAALEPQPTFTLAPTSALLTPEHLRVLRRSRLTIPAPDVDEFLADYYPRLGRTIVVTGSHVLPELHPPELVLTATFEAGRMLRLEWSWLYDGVRRELDPSTVDAGLRDPGAEERTRRAVAAVVGHDLRDAKLRGIDAAEFTAEVLPRLREVPSVRIDVVGEQPDYRELTETPHLIVTATESDRRDWFDLGVIVTVDGRSVPFAPLFSALSKGRKKLLLVDNSYLSLDHPAFDELKRLLDEASELAEWETTPRISRYQAQLWAEFEDLADETVAAQSWREAARGLLDADHIDHLDVPSGVGAELRPYQHDGFDWLAFLHGHGMGGVLADDMGLGKTLQALTLIAHVRERTDAGTAPFLVVAPTSVVSNWVSEAARYVPGLAVQSIGATEGKTQRRVADVASEAQIVVTSYALFRLDFAAYQEVEWAGLILDEAQFVKNPSSIAHQCAVDLNAPVKFALTGTPLENSLLDLWSLFAIVAPGLFASKRKFTEDFVWPITRDGTPEHAAARMQLLRRRIRPLMMRRTKELVASELPAKQEQTLRVELVPAHRALYDAHLQRERQKLLGLVDDLDRNRFIVFRSLTLLRMLSLDASLIDEGADIPSAKLDALLEHLDDIAAEGHRALVFSQFTSFLKLAAARMDAAGIAYEYLDGSTLRRSEVIDRFRGGDAPVFLISLKAGGFGLNLTEADYVFLLDPWWNPASESQAVDRTHRIGQTRPVNVYRLVSSGTIEEKVMALRDKKAVLFEQVMEDDAIFSSTLTADDIRGLLEE